LHHENQNLSVAQKIWVMLTVVIAALLCLGGVLVYALGKNDENIRQQVIDYDQRIRLAEKWSGITELAVSSVTAAAQSSEPDMIKMLVERTQTEANRASEVQRRSWRHGCRRKKAAHSWLASRTPGPRCCP
jgi:flagellar basal body-associated protein FliL